MEVSSDSGAVDCISKVLELPRQPYKKIGYRLQFLKGILVLLYSLLSRQEHRGLIEVQDDVVEQEIANFEHDAGRLDGGIRPRHLPV